MYKIEIKDDMIFENHKRYFKNNIVSNFNNKKITFEYEDIVKLNFKSGKRYHREYVQRQHNKFIKYFRINYKRISVGRINELERIDQEIKKNFPLITKLIDIKYKFSKSNKKYSDEIYSNVLIDLFGYNNFNNKSDSFYEIILNIAKNETKIESISKSNYMSLQHKIEEILCKLFTMLQIEIREFWKKKSDEKKADNLKKHFSELEKKYCLGLTINNYDRKMFQNIWNPYTLIFSLKIRTCPYCNRQYITPILTSDGKSRGNLDHFLPKNKYPYFSMSIYNLVPVCNSCNSSLKGIKEFDFESLNPYEDSLDDYIYFNADINKNHIYVHIDKKNNNKRKEVDKVLDTYKLELQYNYHRNQVRELIIKRLSYSQSYIEDLTTNEQLSDLSEDEIIENLIGYSKDSKNINNEPLSKFRKDIVEQLDFFNNKDDQELISNLRKVLIARRN